MIHTTVAFSSKAATAVRLNFRNRQIEGRRDPNVHNSLSR
jgi:hypothetical protein